jgi:hypothetical protein
MSGKPVILILGCEKYRASLVTALQRFASPIWELVGCIGRPTVTEPEYNETEQIVYLPVPDTYEALPTKVHAAFTWIRQKWPDAPGIFKTDDDIFIQNLSDLERAIQDNVAKPFWGLATSKTTAKNIEVSRVMTRFNDKSLRPVHQTANYCYGLGYWVSSAGTPHISAEGAEYAKSSLEDVCTGYVLNKHGIFPEHVPVKYKEMPRTQ